MYVHPRHADWLGRVLVLQKEMTRSDAQGVTDLEYRRGILPHASNLLPADKLALVEEIKFAINDTKSRAHGRPLNASENAQIANLTAQINLISA